MQYSGPYGLVDPMAPYVNGDPSVGRAGSIPPAAAFEEPQREMANLISNAGFTPSHSDMQQVARSVRQGINFLVGQVQGGNVNTIYATSPQGVPLLDSYRAGLTYRVLWPASNTGPATLNIDALGARTVVRGNGAAVAANDLLAGAMVELSDDGTRMQIVNYQGFTSNNVNNNTYLISIPYVADTSVTANSVLANFSPAIPALNAGVAILVKLANGFTGPATITVNSFAAKAITHPDGSPISKGDAVPGEMMFLTYDGAAFQLANYVPSQRSILTAPRNYYVNASTGSDTFTGLDAAHPFATIQHAIDVVQTFDLNGYAVTIYVAPGSYGPVTCKVLTGSGSCTIIGDQTTPANVTISAPTSAACVVVGRGYAIYGFRFSAPVNSSGATDGIGIFNGSSNYLTIGNLEFLYCAESHIYTQQNSTTSITGSQIRISGGAGQDHMTAYINSSTAIYNPSLTFTTSCNFGGSFCHAVGSSQIGSGSSNYQPYSVINNKGYATGRKFLSNANGIILTSGGGLDYFPGNIAGYIESGSIYS
jgi:hypothetical protein